VPAELKREHLIGARFEISMLITIDKEQDNGLRQDIRY
jgi:hypothetical protein